MTKKEILQALWGARFDEYKRDHFTYSEAMEYAHQLVSTMPDDEWSGFGLNSPKKEDYPILVTDTKSYWVETAPKNSYATNWKRILPPSKPLPTKAEILEKFGISEEQLKEIAK